MRLVRWKLIPIRMQVNFYRIGFYDNILDADKLSMYIEIGYGKEDEITGHYVPIADTPS